jgi:hypothetical protein
VFKFLALKSFVTSSIFAERRTVNPRDVSVEALDTFAERSTENDGASVEFR